MQILPYNSPINSTRLSLNNHQSPNNLLVSNQFDFISLPTITTEHKSYIPYPNCVLEHIIHNHDLTNQEKLFYILVDSLSMINHSQGKQRSSTLPATKWASKLNCSAAKIFTLQKSLEEKGYFSIYRDFNKNGKNKRNVITSTLPDATFNLLANTPNRFNTSTPSTSHLISDSYIPYLESKRAYLDRTKMFIRLNYQPLSLITSHHDLSDYSKVLWLDFFATGYRYYLKHRSINKNVTTTNIIDIDDDYTNNLQSYHNSYSLTATYQELQDKYCCSKPVISKALKELSDLGFITKHHLFVKNDDQDDNLHDKSIWRIVVTIPNNSQQQSILEKSTAKTAEQRDISHCDPYISNSCHIYNKYSIANPTIITNIRDLDNIDSECDFFATETTGYSDVDQLSVSYKNSVKEKIVNVETTRPIIKIQKSKIEIETLNNVPNETLEILEQVSDTVKGKQEQTLPSKPLNEQNDEEISDTTSLVNTELATSVAAVNSTHNKYLSSQTKTLRHNKPPIKAKPLKYFYPLTKEQVDKLNCLSGRKFEGFSVNFANQLLLKLSRDPNKLFLSKNHMMSYMSKAFRYEKHQAPMVNHETFRFTVNVSYLELEMREKEKYLAKVEYSMDTSYSSQLRKKIAGMFETKLAYQILTEGKFDYHATKYQTTSQELEITNDAWQNLELSEENNITQFEHIVDDTTSFVDSSLSLASKHDVANINHDNQLSINFTENDQIKSGLVITENDDIDDKILTRELYELSLKSSLPARQFTNITLANTCTVKLPKNLILTNHQQQNLEKAIFSVYGYVKIVYQQLPTTCKKLDSSRQQYEIFQTELDQNSVWYKIRKKLINNFNEHIDKAWFSKLRSEEDAITQKLTLIAPTNFLKDWINANYGHVIKDIAKKLDYQFVELVTKKQSSLNVA